MNSRANTLSNKPVTVDDGTGLLFAGMFPDPSSTAKKGVTVASSLLPSASFLRLTLLALPLLLGSCSASQEPKPDTRAETNCDDSKVQDLIGQNRSGYLERQAGQAAGATTVRVLRPDDVVTMEFNAQRLNLHVDPGDVIYKVSCG